MFAKIGTLRHRSTGGGVPPVTGGSLQIGNGTSTLYQHPIHYGDNYGINAYIFTAAELGAAKTITGIEFYLKSFSTPVSYPNQRIRMGLVAQSTFPSATPDMQFADLTLTNFGVVKNSFTQSIPNNNVWYAITFDTPFVYDGVSNLLLVWDNLWGSWSSGIGGSYGSNSVTNKNARKMSATSPVTGAGTRTNTRPNVKFNY